MKHTNQSLFIVLLLILHNVPITTGYSEGQFEKKQYGAFTIVSPALATLSGMMYAEQENLFKQMIDEHPEINRINTIDGTGAWFKITSQTIGKIIFDKKIHMNIVTDGKAISGAADIFFAGAKRTIDKGGKLGVHTWYSNGLPASKFQNDDPIHQSYLDYYSYIGFPSELYFFIIHSSGPDEVHYMTPDEIRYFGVLKD